MLNKMRATLARKDEKGFTLIELLVVMIIIGILAAIAIPIFANQQKTARDSATTSDVKNAATNIATGLVANPDADFFLIANQGAADGTAAAAQTAAASDSDDGIVEVWVGNNAATATATEISVTKGTVLTVTGADGDFVVSGFNTKGKSYTDSTSALKYDSTKGGLPQ